MKLLIVLLIVLASISCADAKSRKAPPAAVGPTTSFGCPFGVSDAYGPDPCALAPAPSTAYFCQPNAFAPGGYINTNAATTTDYSGVRPHYNVPGVDYCIGPYTPIAQLHDPALTPGSPNGPPLGCTYTAAAGPNGGSLLCGGGGAGAAFTGTLAHMNMGPVGGHGCTQLSISPGVGFTSYVVDDLYFFNDNAKCSGNGVWFATNVSGTWSNFYVDGNANVFREVIGGCTAGNCNPGVAFHIAGVPGPNISFKYGVMIHWAYSSPFSSPYGSNSGDKPNISWIASWIEGWDYAPANGHTEWYLGGPGGGFQGDILFDHLVQIQDWNVSTFGPAPIFLDYSFPLTIQSFLARDNVVIDSSVGKGTFSATVSGCIGATYVSGNTCSGAGNNFFVTSQTGIIGRGEWLNCGNTGWLYEQVGGPGGSGPGYLAVWSLDSSLQYAPDYTPLAATCTNVGLRNQVANTGWMDNGAILDSFAVKGMYGDFASTPSPFVETGASIATFSGARVTSTTFTPNATATLGTGHLIYAANVVGCTTNVLSCPTIVTGATANTFTLSASGGTAAAQSLIEFNNVATFTGTISGTTLTTTTTQTLTANQFIFGAGVTGCSTGPTSCPTIKTTATGTTFTLNSTGGTVGPETMNSLQNVRSFLGAINGATLTVAITISFYPTFIYASDVCGGAAIPAIPQSCPYITATGTATSFPLNRPTGSFGPETMSSYVMSYCNTPAVFIGNVDMSGVLNSTDMNKWNQGGTWC